MTPPRNKLDAVLGIFLAESTLLFFFYLIVLANLDFAAARYPLFMDERLVYDNVMRMLHPESDPDANGFWWNIYDGRNHLYGRVFYTLSALAAFVPEKLFGTPGAIVSVRLFHAVLLIGSYLILIHAVVRSWLIRAAALLIVLTLPYASFHATMPKPDPLQLFLLALFLRRFIRSGHACGAYWILLGAAFGAKISLLPGVLLLAVVAALHRPRARAALSAAGSFLAGWAIAVPLIATFRFETYWSSTFDFVFTRAQRDATVTWQTWITQSLPEYVGTPVLAVVVLACIVAGALLSTPLRRSMPPPPPILLLLLGLSFILPAIISVKQVWGRYLFSGMTLAAIGTAALAEQLLRESPGFRKFMGGTILALLLINVADLRFRTTVSEYHTLSKRSVSEEHFRLNAQYRETIENLTAVGRATGRRLSVFALSDLYQPDPDPKWKVESYWGFFFAWEAAPDVIIGWASVFGQSAAETPPESSSNYAYHLEARRLYDLHVGPTGGECSVAPCYAFCLESANVQYYVRSELMQMPDIRSLCSGASESRRPL